MYSQTKYFNGNSLPARSYDILTSSEPISNGNKWQNVCSSQEKRDFFFWPLLAASQDHGLERGTEEEPKASFSTQPHQNTEDESLQCCWDLSLAVENLGG